MQQEFYLMNNNNILLTIHTTSPEHTIILNCISSSVHKTDILESDEAHSVENTGIIWGWYPSTDCFQRILKPLYVILSFNRKIYRKGRFIAVTRIIFHIHCQLINNNNKLIIWKISVWIQLHIRKYQFNRYSI